MEPKKRRRRKKYTLIILTDSMEEGVKQIYLGSRRVKVFKAVCSILLIAVICFSVYNPILLSGARNINQAQNSQIKQLMKEKETLEAENKELNDKVAILSETINQKVKTEEVEAAEQAKRSLPTGFPLTGAATIVEQETDGAEADNTGEDTDNTEGAEVRKEEEPILVFKGSSGNMVVASGEGVVTSVEPDTEFGNKVVVDHGNGYCSIYRNKGDTRVKEGDEVVRGSTLFLINDDNTTLGYQITQEGTYINPEDMVEING